MTTARFVAAFASVLLAGSSLASAESGFLGRCRPSPIRASPSAACPRARRRRTTSRTCSRPQFTKATGIKVEFETTSWDQMYDKAIKDMEAKTGIYDFVYIEQDIIYSYLAAQLPGRHHPVARRTTRSSPTPNFNVGKFTTFIDYFKDPKTATSTACRWRPSSRSTSIARTCSTIPKVQEAFKAKYGHDLAPATTHEQYQRHRRLLHRSGARTTIIELWGTTVQAPFRPPGLVLRVLRDRSRRPSASTTGASTRTTTRHASVANGGTMNSPKAKAALTFWIGLLKDAPPEADLQHLGRGRGHRSPPAAPRRAGLRRERRLDRHRRQPSPTSSARSAWRCRRSATGVMEAAEAGTGLYRLL